MAKKCTNKKSTIPNIFFTKDNGLFSLLGAVDVSPSRAFAADGEACRSSIISEGSCESLVPTIDGENACLVC